MNEERPIDIRPGQRWRLADGRVVSVQKVEDDQIEGSHSPSVLGDPNMQVPASVVAYVGHRSDFVNAVLLEPRWHVIAHINDEGLFEEISRLLIGTGTIQHRSSHSMDATAVDHSAYPLYTIEVAAADEAAAELALSKALGSRLKNVRSLRRPN